MSDPISLCRAFQSLLRGRAIESVPTSGMACVEYGLQQSTPDTDWIVAPALIERLAMLFGDLERGVSGSDWRISYRGLFGAPLDAEYLAGGWTSHVAAFDEPESAVRERPLLGSLDAADDLRLEWVLVVEEMLWQCVNRERYLVYQRAWKDFYRGWQQDRVGEWPASEPFLQQHQRACEAVRRHGLPPVPLGTVAARQGIYERGQARAAALVAATPQDMELVAMPLDTNVP